MISSLQELRQANELLAEAKAELTEAGVPFQNSIDVGIMIEVPSAALIADLLAKEVNFFSIGTNDLVQYILAVDRMNEKVAHLYEPYHPAVIRLLKHIVESAQNANISVSVCGELAGDPNALPIWLGLGVKELSVSVQSLLKVKQQLLMSDTEECKVLLAKVLQCTTSEEIKKILHESK
jgi:phosphoenolpyruvate-protein phosphotransferase (PTS system enzyme I)